MTGWDDTCVQRLLELARGPKKEMPCPIEQDLITVDGFQIDSNTGCVVRRDLVLDAGPYGYCAPLYTYDRTNRFSCLLSPCGIPIDKRGLVIRVFEQLEQLGTADVQYQFKNYKARDSWARSGFGVRAAHGDSEISVGKYLFEKCNASAEAAAFGLTNQRARACGNHRILIRLRVIW